MSMRKAGVHFRRFVFPGGEHYTEYYYNEPLLGVAEKHTGFIWITADEGYSIHLEQMGPAVKVYNGRPDSIPEKIGYYDAGNVATLLTEGHRIQGLHAELVRDVEEPEDASKRRWLYIG